jgi:hypothetical protein
MADGGFRKTKKNYWAIESANGNCVVVRIRLYDVGDEECDFHVEWAAVPSLLREFYGDSRLDRVQLEWGLINTRLQVPEERRKRPFFTNLWWFMVDSADEFGDYFQSYLDDVVVPMWKSAIEPDGIRELLSSRRLMSGNYPSLADPARVELVLRFGSAPNSELVTLFNKAKGSFPSSEFVGWVENKLMAD